MRISSKVVAIAFAALFGATQALAQDHLSPDLSVYSDDALSYIPTIVSPVISLLKDAYSDDVRVRVIEHSFIRGDTAVGLKGDRDSYRVFALKSDPRASKMVSKCEARIDAKIALKVIGVWKEMLLRTGYQGTLAAGTERKPVILDGTSYHFSLARYPALPKQGAPPPMSPDSYAGMEGQTFAPDPASKSGALVRIADRMQQFCENKDANMAAQIDQLTEELLQRLK